MTYFHRLVVSTPFLNWDNPIDIEVGEIRIRFENQIRGESISPATQVQRGDHIFIEGGRNEKVEHVGRFIEVICVGEDPHLADLRSRSVMGFLSFPVGDHAVGEVIFSEVYHGDPEKDFGSVSVTSYHDIPTELDRALLDTMVQCLPRIMTSVSKADSLALALRWYQHGVSRTSEFDRVISYFIGIEALLKENAERAGLKSRFALLSQDVELKAFLKKLNTSSGLDVYGRIMNSLKNVSNSERFQMYSENHQLKPAWGEKFGRLMQIRNRGVHSVAVAVSEDDALDAQMLLRIMIRKEFFLVGTMLSDIHPGRFWDSVYWTESEGWVRSPKADWGKRFEEFDGYH